MKGSWRDLSSGVKQMTYKKLRNAVQSQDLTPQTRSGLWKVSGSWKAEFIGKPLLI